MKYLDLDKIKAQLRIEAGFTAEDALLTGYGNSAESTVLNYLNRSYGDLIEQYGAVPQDIINASLMLVDVWYQHRSPLESVSISMVPYTFDLLIKPYIRLAGSGDREITNVPLGEDTKVEFTAALPGGLKLSDVAFSGRLTNIDATNKNIDFVKADCIMTDEGKSYVFLLNTDLLGVGLLLMKLTVQIPDTDFPSGYRRSVVNIDPKIRIIG